MFGDLNGKEVDSNTCFADRIVVFAPERNIFPIRFSVEEKRRWW